MTKSIAALISVLLGVAAALDVPPRAGDLPAVNAQLAATSVPETLDQCFVVLAKKLPTDTIMEMRSGSEDDMVKYHHGLGTWLRNKWGLWDRGPLYQHFHALGLNHPDDMSGLILDSFWRYLNDKPLEVSEQVAHYREWNRLAEQPDPASNPACSTPLETVVKLHWDWPDGSTRIIHMGQCCADHTLWSYEADRGWYRPDARQAAAWSDDPQGRYDPCRRESWSDEEAVERSDAPDRALS